MFFWIKLIMINPAYEKYSESYDDFSVNPILHFVSNSSTLLSPSGLVIQVEK